MQQGSYHFCTHRAKVGHAALRWTQETLPKLGCSILLSPHLAQLQPHCLGVQKIRSIRLLRPTVILVVEGIRIWVEVESSGSQHLDRQILIIQKFNRRHAYVKHSCTCRTGSRIYEAVRYLHNTTSLDLAYTPGVIVRECVHSP